MKTAPRLQRNAYSADEIAKRNGVSRAFVWRQMKEGRLAYRKVGSRRLVLAEDEQVWLGQRRGNVLGGIGANVSRLPWTAG